jgi:RNA polymerase sigma factor (sigma-70 family)
MAKTSERLALGGAPLTSQQQYRAEIAGYAQMLDDEQATRQLVEQAQAGDGEAREALASALLPRIERYAYRLSTLFYGCPRIEYADLVGEGNLAAWQGLPTALEKAEPLRYVLAVAYTAMRSHCKEYASLILTPLEEGTIPLKVESLEQPRLTFGDDTSRTLLDVLAETRAAPPPVADTPEEPRRVYGALYQAVDSLRERERRVLYTHYGLEYEPALTLSEVEQAEGWTKGQANVIEMQALTRLRLCLSNQRPAAERASVCAVARHRPRVDSTITLSPEKEQRLRTAQAALVQQGRPVSVKTLSQAARISPNAATRYLQRERAACPPKSREERLEEAYTHLVASGEEVTVEKVRAFARVDTFTACAYVAARRGNTFQPRSERPAEDRLAEAYAQLTEKGEGITYLALAALAHCDTNKARLYLRARRPQRPSQVERLAEAHAQLEAGGERVSVRALARVAHVKKEAASAYMAAMKEAQVPAYVVS